MLDVGGPARLGSVVVIGLHTGSITIYHKAILHNSCKPKQQQRKHRIKD